MYTFHLVSFTITIILVLAFPFAGDALASFSLVLETAIILGLEMYLFSFSYLTWLCVRRDAAGLWSYIYLETIA